MLFPYVNTYTMIAGSLSDEITKQNSGTKGSLFSLFLFESNYELKWMAFVLSITY